MPNVCIMRRIQKDGLCKENLNVTCIFGWYHEIAFILNENIKLKGVKEKKNQTKLIIQAGIDQIQLIQSALLTVTSTFLLFGPWCKRYDEKKYGHWDVNKCMLFNVHS